jgi:hypothetical protein
VAPTPDQQAVLELLLQPGRTYADLAQLLGIDEEEVRSRARAGLAALGGADPDRSVVLSDYLLGQADPIGRAEAARHLREDPADLELARRICERLREIRVDAELPRLPGKAAGPRPAAPAPPERRGLPALGDGRSRLIAALGVGAVALVAVVLAIAGVFSGEEAPADDATGQAAAEAVLNIPLRPQGSADAAGRAALGIAEDDQLFVDLQVERLEPPAGNQVYVLWFLFDARSGYPLTPLFPDQSNAIDERIPIPTDALALLQDTRSLAITVAPRREVMRAIRRALRDVKLVLPRVGEVVLTGRLPRGGRAGRSGPASREGES